MPVITPVIGRDDLARRLCEATGVAFPVERLVIVVDAREIVRVYVKAPLDRAAVARVCELFEVIPVADVSVADDAAVTIVPNT